MKKFYYIIFVVALYFFNQRFQDFVIVHGLISGLVAGLVIAFLSKLLFSVITKTIIFIAIAGAIFVFLISAGYVQVPAFIKSGIDLLNILRS